MTRFSVRTGNGGRALRFEVHLFLKAGLVGSLDDKVGLGESLFDVAAVDVIFVQDVVLAPDLHPALEPLLHRQRSGKRVDPGADRRERRTEGRLVGRGDQGQDLRDVGDALLRQDGVVVTHDVHEISARDVRSGEKDDPRPVEGGVLVEPREDPMRDGGADESPKPMPRQVVVVHEAGPPRSLLHPVQSWNGGADDLEFGQIGIPLFSRLPQPAVARRRRRKAALRRIPPCGPELWSQNLSGEFPSRCSIIYFTGDRCVCARFSLEMLRRSLRVPVSVWNIRRARDARGWARCLWR